MKTTTGLVSAIFLLSACSPETTLEKAQSDKITFVEKDDPAMLRAFEKARATLDEFLSRAESPAPGESGFAVKVAVKQNDETEYFWITPFNRKGDRFSGEINNEPQSVTNVKLGQNFEFSRADIYDWTYMDAKDSMKGNFTSCALLTHEPPEQATEFKRHYGLECEK